MKIGYICNQVTCVSGASNGIRMQALTWKEALESIGHEVVLLSPWGEYDWKSFDIIHAFWFADSISFLDRLHLRGMKIVVSPIIDTNQNKYLYRISTRWGSKKMRLSSPGYNLRSMSNCIDLFLARTEYEASYIKFGFGTSPDKVRVVPLSYRSNCVTVDYAKKEKFCFHVSSITQDRKNVMRLILAAIKYKFNLVLAGNIGTEEAFAPYKKLIDDNDNLQFLGFISDEELEDMYTRAKVFALPSINEGVGLVALEAAIHGCDIVITNVGGPKEYYTESTAFFVNPYSVDDIGKTIVGAMSETKQPALYKDVSERFNLDECITKLESCYNDML